MHSRRGLRGFTTTEFIVLLLVALVFFVGFWLLIKNMPARDRPPGLVCMSNARELAVATQMYDQDNNGSFPDMHWAGELRMYIGNNPSTFHCPNDKSSKTNISYGYNGLLLCADGNGVKEKDITSPTEVGVFCEAGPSRLYPNGGIVGGGALQPESTIAVTPMPRHSGGTVVGYADGHAAYIPNGYNPKDISNGVTRAFDMAGALGFVDNPTGGINAFPASATSPASVTVGGEPCTRALLLAAAGIWRTRAKAPIVLGGFHGQYAMQQRGSSYLWGTGDGTQPSGLSVAIARDLVVVIIAKNSKIPHEYFCQASGTVAPSANIDMLKTVFRSGYRKNTFQAYTYDANSGTRRFFTTRLGTNGQPLQFGPNSITVEDDFAMVKEVASDPYGIGYCSSAIAGSNLVGKGYDSSVADPSGIQVIDLRTPDGKVHLFPQDNSQARWIMPATPPDWPLTRTLYAECGGKAWRSDGTGIANVMLAPGAPGTKALQAGPLFRASYWTP